MANREWTQMDANKEPGRRRFPLLAFIRVHSRFAPQRWLRHAEGIKACSRGAIPQLRENTPGWDLRRGHPEGCGSPLRE